MENKKITSYEAPQVEVIEVEEEMGFATSSGTPQWNENDLGWGSN